MSEKPTPSPTPSDIPTDTPITGDELARAAEIDDASVKRLLRGDGGERTVQVERIRDALDALKDGLPETKKVERARVGRAARELMDEHLLNVRSELRGSADSSLKELEGRMVKIRDAATHTERMNIAPISVESIKLESGEIARELKDGDWKTWAKYAGVAVAAGVAAKWIWDHTVGRLISKITGNGNKRGFFARATGWLAGAGAAVAATVGLSRYAKTHPSLLPEAIRLGKKTIDRTAKGVKEGFDAGPGETAKRLIDLAGKDGRTAEVERKHAEGEYATEDEYRAARFKALRMDGVEMAWEATGGHLMRSGKHLFIEGMEFWGNVAKLPFSSDKEETSFDIYEVWVNGTIVYATSFGAISSAITLVRTGRPTKALITLATESAVWPITVAGKAKNAGYLLLTKNGRATVREIAGSPWFHLRRVYEAVPLRGQSVGRLQGLVDEWKGWKELERSVRGGGDRELIASLKEKCEAIEQNITSSVKALRIQRGAGESLELSYDLRLLLDQGGDNIDSVKHVLNTMNDLNGHAFASLADEWIDLQRALKEATTGFEKARITERLDELTDNMDTVAKTLREQLNAGKSVDGMTPALRTLVDKGTDKITLTRLLETGNADDVAAAIPLAPKTSAATAAVADLADTPAARAATEAAETGDEWVRAVNDARKTLLAQNATPEAVQAVEEAVQRCKNIGMGVDDALKAVNDPTSLFALTRTPKEYATVLSIATEGGDATSNLRRIGAYIAGFDALDDSARLAKVFNRATLKTLVESGLEPDAIARLLKNPAVRKSLDGADNLDDVLKGLIRWENLRSVNTMINVGGVVMSAAMLGVDIVSYKEMRTRLNETIAQLQSNLAKAGFRKQGDDFVHPSTKKKISVKLLTESIDNLSTEQAYRVGAGVAGTGLAMATVLAPSLALGPAGLAIIGIQLTIEAGLTVLEDDRTRDFLRDTPTSVLAMIGMNQTVGKNEKAVLDESSSWLWSDILHATDMNEADKALLRKKAISIMFFQELGAMMNESPEVVTRILAQSNRSDGTPALKDAGTFLDEGNGAFWNVDFDAVIKPYLAARLFQLSTDSSVRWSEFRELKIDEGILDAENVPEADVRRALREAAHLYAKHLQEKEYRRELQSYAEMVARPRTKDIATLQDIEACAHAETQTSLARANVQRLGDADVFGTRLLDIHDSGNGTSVERYVADVTKRLDERAAGPNDKRASIAKEDSFRATHPLDATRELWLENAAGMSERGIDRPLLEIDVRAIIDSGNALYDELKGVGTAMRNDSVWYANATHFNRLKEFTYVLQRAPRIADEPATKAFLNSVAILSARYSWDTATFGGADSGARNDDFRKTLNALRSMIKSLDERMYNLAPVERASTTKELACVAGREYLVSSKHIETRGDPSVLYVESNGETVAHEAIPGKTYKQTVPGGMIICRNNAYERKGGVAYSYEWSFIRGKDATPGTTLYMYMKRDGAEQPGTTIELPEVKTVTKAVNVDRTLVSESPESIGTGTIITIVYETPDHTTASMTGSFADLLQSGKFAWKKVRVTTPSGTVETTEFVGKGGIIPLRCRIDHMHKPQSTVYLWKKPGQKARQIAENEQLARDRAGLDAAIRAAAPAPNNESLTRRRIRERAEGRGDDASVAL